MSLQANLRFLAIATLSTTMYLRSLSQLFVTDTCCTLKCSTLWLAYAIAGNIVSNDVITITVQNKLRNEKGLDYSKSPFVHHLPILIFRYPSITPLIKLHGSHFSRGKVDSIGKSLPPFWTYRNSCKGLCTNFCVTCGKQFCKVGSLQCLHDQDIPHFTNATITNIFQRCLKNPLTPERPRSICYYWNKYSEVWPETIQCSKIWPVCWNFLKIAQSRKAMCQAFNSTGLGISWDGLLLTVNKF